jgi:hypothetical protein
VGKGKKLSQLFVDLYQRATTREHPRLVMITILRNNIGASEGLLRVASLADLLLELDNEFEDRMRRVADQNRIRIRKIRYLCPTCGTSGCPNAMPVMTVPANMQHLVKHLLAGGDAYEYEE